MHRKQYRVKFHWHAGGGHYYTEWFDTFEEARLFADEARREGLHVYAYEDEEGEEFNLAVESGNL